MDNKNAAGLEFATEDPQDDRRVFQMFDDMENRNHRTASVLKVIQRNVGYLDCAAPAVCGDRGTFDCRDIPTQLSGNGTEVSWSRSKVDEPAAGWI